MPTNLLQESAGVPLSRCHGVTASVSDVKSGKKFIDYNGELLTGTLSLSGNASASDVKSGKTFYSNSFTKQSGSLSLNGNASPEHVLVGRTFYSNSFTQQTGTNLTAYKNIIFVHGISNYDENLNQARVIIVKNGNATQHYVYANNTYEDEFIRVKCTHIDSNTCHGYVTTKFTAYPLFSTWYTDGGQFWGLHMKAWQEYQMWSLHHAYTTVTLLFLQP